MKYLTCILSLTVLVSCVLAQNDITQNLIQHKDMISQNNKLLQVVMTKVESIDNKINNQNEGLICLSPQRLEPISGIIRTDIKGIIEDISPGIEDLTDRDEDELVGSSVSVLMSCENWAKHEKFIEEIVENQTDGILMRREIQLSHRLVKVEVNFIPTEKIFIINMKEI